MSAIEEPRNLTLSFDSASEEDTARLGESLGSALRGGDVLFAEGQLGAGKTCLIRGVCAGLGFRGKVRSPSFAVASRYDGRCPIFHVDLYRIPEHSAELEDISRQEYFSDDAVTLIEWGGKLLRWGVVPSAVVRIDVGEDERRRVELTIEGAGVVRRLKDVGRP